MLRGASQREGDDMTIAVLLADDHRMVREGFRLLLETEKGIKVTGEAGTGHDAVRQAVSLAPDVVLMDISMPELNGIDATRQITAQCPSAKVIILSMYSTTHHIFRAFRAGARGYILKESAGADVIKAIRTVHEGKIFLCNEVADAVMADYIRKDDAGPIDDPLSRLSTREREILQFLVEGNSNAKIAETLFLSTKTVETYKSHVMQKLGINDIPSLVKFAIQRGITSVD
jgi:two-component system, NarL family, response regulator NreC